MKSKDKKASRTNIGIGKDKEMTVTDDPRFSKVLTDPRFKKVPKRVSKVSIDSRFNEVFTDKRFATSSAKVDKRGKLTNKTDNALQMYYHKEDEEDEVKTKKTKKKSKDDLSLSDPESSSESDKLKSESDDDSDSTTDDEVDDADMMTDDDSDVSEEVENVPVIDKETHRLAVVNMDWNQVKAVDLFMMLRSFLPKGGQIKSVAVYPSEFGLKRMEEEALRGPVALLEGEKKKKDRVDVEEKDDADENDKEMDDDDDDEEEDEDEDDDDDDDDNDDDEESDSSEEEDNDEIDIAKLRAYERSKLRYYYAVVECDSIATADYLYKACDGVEFERSSNVLDLRFIPDSMKFPHPPRDVANEAPSDYEGLDFQTRALQQSNVTLSWDDDEPHRVKTLRRNFNEKQLAELELKEFLASDESESDEDESGDDSDGDNSEGEEEDQDPSDNGNKKAKKSKVKAKKAEMYRALLQSGNDSEEDEDEGQDMEVTFNSGLEDISKKILEKKDKGSETVWEAYLRKKKEKKKARKFRSKNSSDDESDESDQEPLDQPDDFFEDEPSTKSKKASRGKKTKEEKRPLEDEARVATAAELELLLADEKGAENNLKGYKIKMKKVKGKKDKQAIDEEKLPTIDYDDPRFSALFSNPGFALDPTDPQFKRSATYFRQLAQRHENNRNGDAEKVPEEPSKPIINNSVIDDENPQVKSRKEKFELSSIVKGIKLKSQMIPKPTDKMKHGSSVNGKKHKLEVLDRKIAKKSKSSK